MGGALQAARRRPGARFGNLSTQQRLAGLADGDDGDGDGGFAEDWGANARSGGSAALQLAPLMDDGILERVNFNLDQLNAYLQARGTQEGDTPLHVAAMEGHVEVRTRQCQCPFELLYSMDGPSKLPAAALLHLHGGSSRC